MKKTIACVIARTVSTRLPLKVLRMVNDEYSMIEFIINRLKLVNHIEEIYLCTSKEPVDDVLEDIAIKNKVKVYRGSSEAVIERLISAGEIAKADNVVRITGDNVFTACEYLDAQIEILNEDNLDYIRIIDVPVGATAEVISIKALKDCYLSIDPSLSEYLLLFIFNPEKYNCGVLKVFNENFSQYSLTVDTAEDLERTKAIFSIAGKKNKLSISLDEIVKILKGNALPFSILSSEASIKMPYGKVVTLREFQKDMATRIRKANFYQI